MLTISPLGAQIAARRRKLGLSQAELAKKASIGRSTLDALENGRIELKLQETGSRRPTLDELMQEDRDDQGLDRRR
jgi:transcriptional regulator with XRE-family HTH domain